MTSFKFCLLPILATACLPASWTAGSQVGTAPSINEADVRSRMLLIADDSMLGRQAGTAGNFKMTDYLAREAMRMGLTPAGDDGTFFQNIPMVMRTANPASLLRTGNDTLVLFTDFAPIRPSSTARLGTRIDVGNLPAVFGGRAGDSSVTLDSAAVAGKLLVFSAPLGSDGQPSASYSAAAGTESSKYPGAAGIAIASLELQPTPALLRRAGGGLVSQNLAVAPGGILVSAPAAAKLMGGELSTLLPGSTGGKVTARIGFLDSAVKAPARNVVAMKRGSDPALQMEYVAIGAHSDHLGILAEPLEHDSIRAFNRIMRPEGSQSPSRAPNPTQWNQIRTILDSLRNARPARLDSVYNGADDDGSGSVALLEIAEAFAAQPAPRRSVLFVWHTAEEPGLLGSMYFTEHTPVPRASIVAQINMDMVGRGRSTDTPRGGPRNLQLIGSRRLSSALGSIVDSVNLAQSVPWEIDLGFDAPGHPLNRYCRSDHQNYARYGIPVAYFSRGYHQDYHIVTDEAQYIDYASLGKVATFVREVTLGIANRQQKPVVDKPRPNPLAPCRQ